jgi:hypothetical protein
MRYSIAFVATVFTIAACGTSPSGRSLAPNTPISKHVGYKGPDEPYGFVTNNAECHVGKRGNRWPQSEWYDVKDFDAHLVLTPSGEIEMTCSGQIPPNQPIPTSAEVEQGVLCFLPNQLSTRHAQEEFTPSGNIILACHYNPNSEE